MQYEDQTAVMPLLIVADMTYPVEEVQYWISVKRLVWHQRRKKVHLKKLRINATSLSRTAGQIILEVLGPAVSAWRVRGVAGNVPPQREGGGQQTVFKIHMSQVMWYESLDFSSTFTCETG